MSARLVLLIGLNAAAALAQGSYTNPVIHADYSDPDVIRVDGDYYLVASSFCQAPGLPVLHSRDLVHWEIISHAVPRLPSPHYNRPRHGGGIWAPSIRYHRGEFYIYYGDPDLGLFMVRGKNPAGPWEPPLLIREARGWIDPCPLWDDDGQAYLVHAWAKSRAGINSILTVHRMSPDGKKILDEGVTVFDGHDRQPTIEGPKFYKHGGWYYLFAPAGGVKNGCQTVLRSRAVFGPYEERIVLEQGSTAINGPHQGGWVETAAGESWFIHFQDHGAYGRILHLEPMRWREDWPLIGIDRDGNGVGEPVNSFRRPTAVLDASSNGYSIPQSDEFSAPSLGLQWQWQANIDSQWYSLTAAPGFLRLYTVGVDTAYRNGWDLANIVGQKFPAEEFEATIRMIFHAAKAGERAGLIIFGDDYTHLSLIAEEQGYLVQQGICREAEKGGTEEIASSMKIEKPEIFLQVRVRSGGRCTFTFSEDGAHFLPFGSEFIAVPGKWVGARVGLFAMGFGAKGHADFDYVRFKIFAGDE